MPPGNLPGDWRRPLTLYQEDPIMCPKRSAGSVVEYLEDRWLFDCLLGQTHL